MEVIAQKQTKTVQEMLKSLDKLIAHFDKYSSRSLEQQTIYKSHYDSIVKRAGKEFDGQLTYRGVTLVS